MLLTDRINHLISFDEASGILVCEGGVEESLAGASLLPWSTAVTLEHCGRIYLAKDLAKHALMSPARIAATHRFIILTVPGWFASFRILNLCVIGACRGEKVKQALGHFTSIQMNPDLAKSGCDHDVHAKSN